LLVAAVAAIHASAPVVLTHARPTPANASRPRQEAKEAEDNKKLAAQKDGDVDCKQQ